MVSNLSEMILRERQTERGGEGESQRDREKSRRRERERQTERERETGGCRESREMEGE